MLPLHTPTAKGDCSCGRRDCGKSIGKHPRIREWQKQATTEEQQIRLWWKQWPAANPGIATGRGSGFWVLDVDPRHGGDLTLHELERTHGELPRTAEALTAGGGRHICFAVPEDFEVRNIQRTDEEESPLGAGLDLRGEGGLIVGAGACGPKGRGWEWNAERHPDDTPFALAPPWLLELVKRALGRAGPVGTRKVPDKIPHGRQHNTLVSIAGRMRDQGLEPEEIEAALLVINAKRCEQPGPEENIRKIARSMVRYQPSEETREPPPEGRPSGASDAPPVVWDAPPPAEPVSMPAPLRNGEMPAAPRMNGRQKGKEIIPKPRLITAAELMRLELPAPRWAVPEVLPEGVSILAGKPKKGKSWLALQTCLAVAAGGRALGKVPVEQGQVLYLALEDSRRRLKGRMAFLLDREAWPEELTLAAAGDWFRIGEGGKIEIEDWLSAHERARLVVVDTFGRFRVPPKPGANVYDEEYREMNSLKTLADQAGCALMVIHHLRKMDADDPFDTISGSLGLTAAADAILVLQRERGGGEARLHITGRDVEDRELALQWEAHSGWTLMGEAVEYERTQEQAQVMETLRALGKPSTPGEVAGACGISRNTIKLRMWRMAEAGLLVSENGIYRISLKAYDAPEVTNGCNRVTGAEDDPFLSTD